MTKMRATDLVLDLMDLFGKRVGELSEAEIRSLGMAPLAGGSVDAALPAA